MEEKKVSIIIPVYNSEETLKKCIESVINQTYKNIEILVINDGSKDKSLKIINEYKNKDKRIKIRYAICAFMFIYWLIIAIYRPEWYGTIPYKFFWEGY